jgi:hypothetical protein
MSACGGSFVNSPSCADNPKSKTWVQKIICQGQANPVDSITFALLTSATVPAVIAQTAKWIRCGKPSKGAPYAYGALALWGLEVARSLNNIHNDEKSVGEVGVDFPQNVLNFFSNNNCNVQYAFSTPYEGIWFNIGNTNYSFNISPQQTTQINDAKNPQEIYNVLKTALSASNIDSKFEFGFLTLSVGDNIICGTPLP